MTTLKPCPGCDSDDVALNGESGHCHNCGLIAPRWNALPRRSDVAAAFREGFDLAASEAFKFPQAPWADACKARDARMRELNNGALPSPGEKGSSMKLTVDELVSVWDAINATVIASGGRADARTVARMKSVVRTEEAIGEVVRARVVAAMREALEICRREVVYGPHAAHWNNAEAAINARIAELSK